MAEAALGSRVPKRLYHGSLQLAFSRCNKRYWINYKRSCHSSRAHILSPPTG